MTRAQLTYALLATICWGCYIVVAKVASSERYCNVPPRWTTALMGLGIVGVFAVYWRFSGGAPLRASIPSIASGLGAGLLWATGMVFALLALRGGAEVARLVPLYNANTLVALALAFLVLREIPQPAEIAKLTLGSLLIVIGGVLVAR
ncbi:MAG: EamA family transporter [Armatimonadota bacterium]